MTQIRLENLKSLVKPEGWGNVAKFARDYNLSENQLRGLLKEDRVIGEKLARKLEGEIGLSEGILDVEGMEAAPAREIEDAINRASFLSDAEKQSFIAMVHAIKNRKE